MKTKHVGGILCFVYEGPDGCNAEECYCRTDTTTIQQEHADKELESSRFISVKTLKCVNKTNASSVHYLVMKLPLCMYNSIAWMQQTTAEIWATVTDIYVRGTTYMMKIKDKVVESATSLSPYLERMEKNAKRYCRVLVGDADDETVLNPTVYQYQPTKTKGHVENLEADGDNNETVDEEGIFAENADGELVEDNYFDNFFDDTTCSDDGSA